jgi:signal peptidase II
MMLENQQPPVRTAHWGPLAAACAGSLALDQWTKQWAWDSLRGGARMVWEPVLELAFAYNRGSAFGVVRELDRPLLLLAIGGALVAWTIHAVRSAGAGRAGFVGAGLVAGGAFGNLYDRVFRVDELGQRGVVDFIKINYPWGGSWPTFNVADVVLVIGAVLLVYGLRERRPT